MFRQAWSQSHTGRHADQGVIQYEEFIPLAMDIIKETLARETE